MKRFLLILAMGLMLLPSFGRKIIVVEITKEGDGWQNLFNLYREVTTTYIGNQNGTPCVNLSCFGAGYTWCRASRQIGEQDYGSFSDDISTVFCNAQIVNAINELIEASEQSYSRGVRASGASKKVAVRASDKTDLYFVKATWNYGTRGGQPEAKIIVTIEVDDSSMLNRHI